ncbi:MAG: hypothetical protein LC804_25720, partial [Acidobacteria bacterium]|nr:hypothetical protein [Acidobacteriota bacterium]
MPLNRRSTLLFGFLLSIATLALIAVVVVRSPREIGVAQLSALVTASGLVIVLAVMLGKGARTRPDAAAAEAEGRDAAESAHPQAPPYS